MANRNKREDSIVDPQNYLPCKREIRYRVLNWMYLLTGFIALIWFFVRVIPKPSRATYPCQRLAFPLASGLVAWTAGLIGSAFFLKRAKKKIVKARYVAGCLCIVTAGLAASIPLFTADSRPVLADPPVSNNPIGVARGIHPGRVVWVHDPAATDWGGAGDGHWFEAPHTNQAVVDTMLSQAIRALAGEGEDAGAWDAIFRHFNQRRGLGNVGYLDGQKIAIKVNHTLSINADPVTFVKNSMYIDHIDNSPQLTIALLDQLVNAAGVAEADIRIGDPTRIMPNYWYDRVHAAFPNVVYTARKGGLGRVQETLSGVPFYWSDPVTSRTEGKTPDYVPTSFADADYIINFPILKSHDFSGITICAKNHYGSLLRLPIEAGYYDMHLTWLQPDGQLGYGHYRALVDLMGHEQLGGKTVLYLVDGLFAGQGWAGAPAKWNMAPFNGDWPSSILLSQDPVAIDSVGFDFLYEEWPDRPHLSGADDYLIEAALADNPPSVTFYDPENDGTPMDSLGVHEHWNNSTDKQYSRNLGTGDGIELIIHDTDTPPPAEIIIDNRDAGFSSGPSQWPLSSSTPGGYDTTYRYGSPGDGSKWARWTFQLSSSGNCEVFAQWTAHENRSFAAPYAIINNGTQVSAPVTVDQRVNGGVFRPLGTFWLEAGTVEVVLNNAPTGYVIADAVKIVSEGGPPPVRTLDHIEIEGPPGVDENSAADYVVRAHYSDNTKVVVSADSWSEDCSSAEIDASGYVTTYEVTANETCYVNGYYTEDSVEHQDSFELIIHDTDTPPPAEIIIDNRDAGFSSGPSQWPLSSSIPGGYDTTYRYGSPGDGSKWARWTFQLSSSGNCEVFAQWTAHENRSFAAPYAIINNGTQVSAPVTVDQRVNGGVFRPLGTFWLEAGTVEVVLNNAPTGYVIADAVKIVSEGGPPPVRTLDHIEIEGPPGVDENSAADYVVRAHYSDNTNVVVSADSWSEDCSSAEIDASGYVTTYEVTANETCYVNGYYTEDSVEHQDSFELIIHDTDTPPPAEIIIDNRDAGFSSGPSQWPLSSSIPGGYDTTYRYGSPGDGSKWARWTFQLSSSGNCEVFAQWTAHENRSFAAPYAIINNGTQVSAPVTVDQRVNGGVFRPLGTFWLEAGTVEVVLNNAPTGYVIADAVKITTQ